MRRITNFYFGKVTVKGLTKKGLHKKIEVRMYYIYILFILEMYIYLFSFQI